MNFGEIKNIHFVGVGGIGMSGIAEVLAQGNHSISGCDLKASELTRRLEHRGIRVAVGHDPEHVSGMDLVVTSSAVRDNAEVRRARELGIPVMRRAEMLGEIVARKKGIAVSGTHGKTTTSAMVSNILTVAGLDPTVIVGGVLRNLETNARIGSGEHLIVEADEYDRSFLTLHPAIAVVTNIEADHLEYYGTLDAIHEAFAQFLAGVAPAGVVIGCVDDPHVAQILPALSRAVGYGLGDAAALRAVNVKPTEAGSTFDVTVDGVAQGRVELSVPGLHNVRNALAAIGVAREVGVPFETIASALAGFRGVERRFQIVGEVNGAIVVDDYAHHPTEIAATLEAARGSYPSRRIVALFQPHLYSRTRDFCREFAESLAKADVALVAPIYAAREEPDPQVTSRMITDAAAKQGASNVELVDRDAEGLAAHVRSMLTPDDIFVTMGAGDVNRVGKMLLEDRR